MLRMISTMRKHTTLDLDLDVVDEAAAALGTRGTGETVRAALEEVVRHWRRQKLLELTTDLGLDQLERIRTARFGDAKR
jgi:Arc/MetJ family transcription regulator